MQKKRDLGSVMGFYKRWERSVLISDQLIYILTLISLIPYNISEDGSLECVIAMVNLAVTDTLRDVRVSEQGSKKIYKIKHLFLNRNFT